MKKILIFVAVILLFIALVAGLWIWSSANEAEDAVVTPVNADIILFYGDGCPHCVDVDKFIEENKISEKVAFDSLEVWRNKANSKILLEKAQECNIPEDKAGVPFLYSKGKCFMGTPEIEKFFKLEAGI